MEGVGAGRAAEGAGPAARSAGSVTRLAQLSHRVVVLRAETLHAQATIQHVVRRTGGAL